jgi:energy-coupling factor transporter transmembrane protein EcfT
MIGVIAFGLQAYTDLIFPVLGKSMASLKFKVISLEMRAFRLSSKRTSLYNDHLRLADYVLQICFLLVLLAFIFWRITHRY